MVYVSSPRPAPHRVHRQQAQVQVQKQAQTTAAATHKRSTKSGSRAAGSDLDAVDYTASQNSRSSHSTLWELMRQTGSYAVLGCAATHVAKRVLIGAGSRGTHVELEMLLSVFRFSCASC